MLKTQIDQMLSLILKLAQEDKAEWKMTAPRTARRAPKSGWSEVPQRGPLLLATET